MAGPGNQNSQRKPTRREFIRASAAITATLAATNSPFGIKAYAAAELSHSPLFLPPFLSRPTERSIFISALNNNQPSEAVIEVRKENATDWERRGPAQKVPEYAFFNWDVPNLSPAARYEYRVLVKRASDETFASASNGSFRTQRKGPASYKAVLITDPHTGTFAETTGPVQTLDKVIRNASQENAEFVLALGDNVAWAGSREYAQTNSRGAVSAYALYRKHIGPLTQNCPHFGIIGNWAGESGKFPEASIRMISGVRQTFLPNPNHETYPQGGSEREDYYAFSWGDVLYVMLNVQTYSKPSKPDQLPSLMADVNTIDEWTIGEAQMKWLEKTLQHATERFRFVCMHHPAGGNAGDVPNTLYGRGGARACNTGEQVRIHNLMKKHKVQIFFYGHDHVFVDDIVDGIHYALPGSCGAPWKFTKEETGYERFWPDSGHARLDVTPEKATVTFINLEGKEIHNFSVLPA
ncbi:MAG: metallophosphoesterase [Verrucomicrobia bacterium]|nr:metallophosphoesterase [Verrucomicrobiota bacterium]